MLRFDSSLPCALREDARCEVTSHVTHANRHLERRINIEARLRASEPLLNDLVFVHTTAAYIMADVQEKVAADTTLESAKEEEPKVDAPEENEKPKRGRRSKSSFAKVQEEAENITKGLPGADVPEGRRMTRSAVRGTPPVTPSPPPKKERRSAGASGGEARGKKRRQRKLAKEDDEEEDEELEEGEKKSKTPKKAEENGDDGHEEEAVSKKETDKKDEEKMEVDEANGDASSAEKEDEPKPVVKNTEKDKVPVEEAAKKDETVSEKPSEVNNVESKIDEGKTKIPEKASIENSSPEKVDEAESNENKAPSEDSAPAKGVPQEPVAVSQ